MKLETNKIICSKGGIRYFWNKLKPNIIYFDKKIIDYFPSNIIISVNFIFLINVSQPFKNKNGKENED